MTNGATYRVAVLALSISALSSIAWLCSSCREPATSQTPRYHGQQPDLKVSLLPDSDTSADVPKVIAVAKGFWKPTDKFWPEPSSISERQTFWWVKFAKKEKVVVRDGQEVVLHTLPGVVCIQVEKADLSCKIIPAR